MTHATKQPQITSFSLTVTGLQLTYTNNNQQTTLSYDPLATCALFEELGFIEGFDRDSNGEPVILYTDKKYGTAATGFYLWCDYAPSFGFIQRHAEIIVEARESTRKFKNNMRRINRLLSGKPLPKHFVGIKAKRAFALVA